MIKADFIFIFVILVCGILYSTLFDNTYSKNSATYEYMVEVFEYPDKTLVLDANNNNVTDTFFKDTREFYQS